MPTPNQEAVVKEVVETIGKHRKVSVSAIAKKHGYSPSYANSGLLQRSDGWLELMEKYLPDDMLARTHKDLLQSVMLTRFVFPADEDDEIIKSSVESVPGCKLFRIVPEYDKLGRIVIAKIAYFHIPDSNSRNRAIETAYKIKGKIVERTQEIPPYEGLDVADLLERRQQIEEQLKRYEPERKDSSKK